MLRVAPAFQSNLIMAGDPRSDAPATLADLGLKPLQRRKTQSSDYTDDPPTPHEQIGDPLDLPQLNYASKSQLWWDGAMCQALRLPKGYHKAAVLMLKWDISICEFGNIGADEVNSLKEVFEKSFNFDTTLVPLSHFHKRPPELYVKAQVERFVNKYNNPNDLLIVYYSGHASVHPTGQSLDLHP